MGTKTYKFLGESFEINDDLSEYLKEYNKLYTYAQPLYDELEKQMKEQSYRSDEDEDFIYWIRAAEKAASLFVEKAKSLNVYDLSVQDLLNGNNSFNTLKWTCHEMGYHMYMNLMNGMNEWFDKYTAAADNVDKEITGPGFGILTNSLSSVLLYELVSYGAERRQFEVANEKFKNYIGQLNNSVNDKISSNNQKYLTLYYTYIRDDIFYTVEEMLFKYFDKL